LEHKLEIERFAGENRVIAVFATCVNLPYVQICK
jgi:hypothetical protein